MTSALHSLVAELIDYAGLYPPARLPMDEAVAKYLSYREGPHSSVLGPFVVHANCVRELADCLPEDDIVEISALLGGAETTETDLGNVISNDVATLEKQCRTGMRIEVTAMEMRLPAGASIVDAIRILDRELTSRPAIRLAATARTFIEVPVDGSVDITRAAVQAADWNRGASVLPIGLKIRCGYDKAEHIPSVPAVAHFLLTCHSAGCFFKATAGLHHPLRHHSTAAGGDVHGFVNVFGGACLAFTCGLGADELEHILDERSVDAFRFEGDRLTWKDRSVTSAQIVEVRSEFALSLGSCSFEEPLDDLHEMGLL